MYRLGHGPHELYNLGRVSSHLNRLGIDMGHAQHPPGVTPLVGKNQGDHIAGAASPGRTPRPVQERLGIGWWIHLDHQVDVTDVHAAGGHVGSHQDFHLASREGPQVAIALVLGKVSV